ncbi:MAG: acetyl-CoA synthase subunit gamma [Deltaproteobacteria bacterium]|nr:acetyl-CoA synthase subunit gamma [Deltaproteobacteria bacterium]
MKDFGGKKKIRIGDIKKTVSCCGPQTGTGSCCPEQPKPKANFKKITADLDWKDHFEHFRCRVGSYRMKYTVEPGLYALGEPDKNSDVFVSANYKMSFNKLRGSLQGINAWILVLDTKGINVWCAAGKGTFGTDELVKRIFEARLFEVVSHKRIIAPQLGAPGIAAHAVQAQTGFRVYYGPVQATDIKDYIKAGYKATKEMRRVEFPVIERLVLTPMELNPALKYFPLYALAAFFIFGLRPEGLIFKDAFIISLPYLALGLATIASGAFITPLLLPFIPFRSFALKGWIIGFLSTALMLNLFFKGTAPILQVFSYILYPMLSSYIAAQFTGSSTFTNISGVKKELRLAIPVYIISAIASALILIVFKIGQWSAL